MLNFCPKNQNNFFFCDKIYRAEANTDTFCLCFTFMYKPCIENDVNGLYRRTSYPALEQEN